MKSMGTALGKTQRIIRVPERYVPLQRRKPIRAKSPTPRISEGNMQAADSLHQDSVSSTGSTAGASGAVSDILSS